MIFSSVELSIISHRKIWLKHVPHGDTTSKRTAWPIYHRNIASLRREPAIKHLKRCTRVKKIASSHLLTKNEEIS